MKDVQLADLKTVRSHLKRHLGIFQSYGVSAPPTLINTLSHTQKQLAETQVERVVAAVREYLGEVEEDRRPVNLVHMIREIVRDTNL